MFKLRSHLQKIALVGIVLFISNCSISSWPPSIPDTGTDTGTTSSEAILEIGGAITGAEITYENNELSVDITWE